jgi:hypothetical protein
MEGYRVKSGIEDGFTPRFIDPDGLRLQMSAGVIGSANDLNAPFSCRIDPWQNSANQGRRGIVGKPTRSFRHWAIQGIPSTSVAGGYAARLF